MKRIVAAGLSVVVTVLLGIIVLTAGQPRTQTSSTVATGAVQSVPASDVLTPPQSTTGHFEHDGNEHRSRSTSNLALNDD